MKKITLILMTLVLGNNSFANDFQERFENLKIKAIEKEELESKLENLRHHNGVITEFLSNMSEHLQSGLKSYSKRDEVYSKTEKKFAHHKEEVMVESDTSMCFGTIETHNFEGNYEYEYYITYGASARRGNDSRYHVSADIYCIDKETLESDRFYRF